MVKPKDLISINGSADVSTPGQPPRNFSRHTAQKTQPKTKLLDAQDAGISSEMVGPDVYINDQVSRPHYSTLTLKASQLY